MSIDNSKPDTSPPLEEQNRRELARHDDILQAISSVRRTRRSYSMVSSLEKLNRVKNNLLDFERKNSTSGKGQSQINITKVTKNDEEMNYLFASKVFIGQET